MTTCASKSALQDCDPGRSMNVRILSYRKSSLKNRGRLTGNIS